MEILKTISENPDAIAEFDAEQVTEAKDALKAFMADVKNGDETATREELAEVKRLNEALTARADELQAEKDAFDADLAELEQALGLSETEEAPADNEDDADPPEALPETEETPEVEAETEETTEVEEKELVTASANKPALKNIANRVPKERKPQPQRPALVASADTGVAGQRIESPEQLAEVWINRHDSLRGQNPPTGQLRYPVASYKATSRFGTVSPKNDQVQNTRILNEVVAEYKRVGKDSESLTAALEFCAPAQPIYEQFGNVSTDGLLMLPTVPATRGRVTFPNSLSFQDLTGVAGIGSEWDGSGNKSVYTFNCPETTSCEVVANVTILQVNNATGRFYPEAVADLNSKALATARQDVNGRHLVDIAGNAKVNTLEGEDTGAGAIVNIANNVAFHAAEYREKYRLSKGALLDAVFPHWVFDALWVDAYARDSTNEYAGVRAKLAGMLSDLNIRPQFVYGWQDISPDLFGTFPPSVDIMLWEPGTVVRLDSGTLDLGVVRDSTLNATNDYQTFVETFEAICVPGHEILLINDVPICPSGGTGNRVTIECAATPS